MRNLLTTTIVAALLPAALAQPVDEFLDMSVRPSDAGWTYLQERHDGTEETNFVMEDGFMHQYTMGLDECYSGGCYYHKNIPLDPNANWVAEARVALLDWHSPCTNYYFEANGRAGVYFTLGYLWLGLYHAHTISYNGITYEEDGIGCFYRIDNGPPIEVIHIPVENIDQFHVYRAEGNAATGDVDIFVDGVYSGTFNVPELSELPTTKRIAFGDGTNSGGGEALWDYYHFYQDDSCSGQVLGDANCDGVVNNFDIDAFVLALTSGQQAWETQYGSETCGYLCACDINGDALVNNFDIDPFVALLTTK